MIPIYKPYMPKQITEGIEEILYSGQLSFGKYGKMFESQLQNYIGCEYLLSVSSYNIAMQIILSTLGLEFGDEVIASPVSCLASNQPFISKGLRIIWVDVDPRTGSMCPDDLKSKITKKTKVIFHNHFCGYLGKIDKINEIGKSFGIPVVDDCIEAFGSQYKGNKLGNVGTDFTVFSFQTVRLPNTIDGGAIVFKSKIDYEKALLIRDYGIDRTNFRTKDGEINKDCDISVEGYAGMMSELNSFIGTRQMLDIEILLSTQKRNADAWKSKITLENDFEPLAVNTNTEPNYWVYGIICDDKEKTILDFKSKGFYASGVHINNNIYSIFNNKSVLTGVNEFIKRFAAIPSGWWVDLNIDNYV